MELEKIQRLIELLNEHQLTELKFAEANDSLYITKLAKQTAPLITTPTVTSPSAPLVSTNGLTTSLPAITGHIIRSPMVGTAYLAPKPGDKPFVTIGQSVEKGAKLCIIEAMKMMNHIEADRAGVIKACLVENSEPIEFDQPLFILE
jgi:acetyl-CoA carboxylase biotin carboxyl carrier protein